MNEARRLRDAVWSSRTDLRHAIEESAAAAGVEVYLVGGFVRDLMLGLEPTDLDLTVVGDGLGFATDLGRRVSGEVDSAPRFLTSVVRLPDGSRIDVATARSETYRTPGSLPQVRPATISADLGRRDFTVNTFALGLAGECVGSLLVSDRGREDLRRRLLRVLHPDSFRDDPTRILRAVRLEARRGFRLEERSEGLAREALVARAFDTVSGERLWSDLRPLLEDAATVARSCRRLQDLGVLMVLADGLEWSEGQEALLAGALGARALGVGAQRGGTSERVVDTALVALASCENGYRGVELAERLKLPATARDVLVAWPSRLERVRQAIALEAAPSAVHRALAPLSLAELGLVAAHLGANASVWVRRELAEFRRLELGIGARDLLRAGHASGPAIGRALERTLAARLDGQIGREQELDYALAVLDDVSPPARETDESE